MKLSVSRLIRKQLSIMLACVMLTSIIGQNHAAAQTELYMDVKPVTTVTENVYQPQGGVADSIIAPPLSWNMLNKFTVGLGEFMAAIDRPIVKLSSDDRYLAFMRYTADEEAPIQRRVVNILDRSTGLHLKVKMPDDTGSVVNYDMTPDARYVAYTYADSLTSGNVKVYVYDRVADILDIVNGIGANKDFQFEGDVVSISADGRYIAFDTEAQVLHPEDADAGKDVYLYDRDSPDSKLERISTPIEESAVNSSYAPSISADGSLIAFYSRSKLTDGPSGGLGLYVYNRNATDGQTVQRVADVSTIGGPSISGDGRFVAFTTEVDELDPRDTNQLRDVYVYNLATGSFRMVSQRPDGSQHVTGSKNPSLSRDGNYVAYEVATEASAFKTDIYITDIEGSFTSKVEVPSSPYRLQPSSSHPHLGESGQSLAYFSSYMETLLGMEFAYFDYFIATKGTAPTWAEGSGITASNLGTDHLTLHWPQAMDPEGVAGYTVYRNSIPMTYVDAGSDTAVSVTLTNLTRENGIADEFIVKAIDRNYDMSTTLLSYTWNPIGGGNPPPDDMPLSFIWSAERSQEGYGPLIAGSNIMIHANGASGREAEVNWTYKVWVGEEQVTESSMMMLPEMSSGTGMYTGTFQLPANASELTSLTVTLTDGEDEEVEAAEELPLAVEGTLNIQFSGADAQQLDGSNFTIYSPLSGDSYTFGEDMPESLTGLWPSDQYKLELFTSDFSYKQSSLSNVVILPGKTTTVTLSVTLPARLRVDVIDPQGDPVFNVPVALWDEAGQPLHSSRTGLDGSTDWIEGLPKGQTVRVTANLDKFPYELTPDTNLEMLLNETDNILTLQLAAPDRGELAVTVKNPANQPVFNAYVTATQVYKGLPVVTRGSTSLNGMLSLELYAGPVELEVVEYSYNYSSGKINAEVAAETTTPLDVPVKQPDTGVVNVKIYKKALDDLQWLGPLSMDSGEYRTEVSSGLSWSRSYFSNAFRVGGSPGAQAQVCVTGKVYANLHECTTVTLDENSNATAEIRLEETGARVQGIVEIDVDTDYTATVYKVASNGLQRVTTAYDNDFYTNPFNINVPSGGAYRMLLTKTIRTPGSQRRYEYASVDFAVEENQIQNLGTIEFSPTSYFANRYGNHFSAQPARALPGSTLVMRAAYRNNQSETAKNAVLLLDIPTGMSIVSDGAGHLAVSGHKSAVTIEGQTLQVPLGDLTNSAEGIVTYKLLVSPTFNEDSISVGARLQAELGTEWISETIGTVHLETPKVTIDAPERVANEEMQTLVAGYAPVGSTVDIYDSNVKIAGAVANSAGIWKAQVTLNDLGSPSLHSLWAQTTAHEVVLKSNKVYVEYDFEGPELVQMAFSQMPDKRWVTVNLKENAPNFPYTVVPGYPFQFDFQFTNPDLVENVRVYMEGQEGDPILAVKEGELFRAIVPTETGALGGIYVDYDVMEREHTYDGQLPSMEQIKEALPPGMREFEVVSATPFELSNGIYTGTAKLNFPQMDDTTMTITFTINTISTYRPSEEERELAHLSGVPAIQKSYEVTESDTSLAITMKGYMPRNLILGDSTSLVSIAARRPSQPGEWEHVVEYAMDMKIDVDETKGHIDKVKGQYETYKGYSEKINKIMYNFETSGMDCIDELGTSGKQFGKALVSVVMGEIAKTAMGAWTGAMALTGPGAIVAGFATSVAGKKIDSYVDQQISAVGTGYNQCNDKPDKKKGRKIADPRWIYDPSGYVYEAVKSNPLEGVKATVYYLDTATGDWKAWDAEEYEQINPQMTDQAGKYGWDVPPGKWKVMWTKAGYVTQSSAELDVPPPYTEVNAGLVTLSPPEVQAVTGVTYADGSYVDITFTKYVKVGALPDGAIKVSDQEGNEIEGTMSFVQNEESASEAGVMLSPTVRFTSNEKLALAAYELNLVPSAFIGYNNLNMQSDESGPHAFLVEEQDIEGPVLERAKVESGGRIIRLTFKEPIQPTAAISLFRINGETGAVNSAAGVLQQNQSTTKELLISLSHAMIGTVNLTGLEGAVKDLHGNSSSAFTVELEPDLQPELSGITVEAGVLTTTFQPDVTQYTVRIPAGTTELRVTASTASEGAKLWIESALGLSGITKSIAVPADGIVDITVELGGGVASRTYTLQVEYTSPPPVQGDGGSGGYSGPTKTEDISARKMITASDGTKVLHVTVALDALKRALQSLKTGHELVISGEDPAVDKVLLELPIEGLKELGDAGAILVLQAQGVHAKLDAKAVVIDQIPAGSMVRLALAALREEEARIAESAADKQSRGLRLVSTPVQIQLEAVTKDAETRSLIQDGHSLQLLYVGIAGDALEVYSYDASTQQWSFINSSPASNDMDLSFHTHSAGVYAVISFTHPFKDIVGHWAEQEVDWMARRLLVNGMSRTEFQPQRAVTRAEFTAMLVRALEETSNYLRSDVSFIDVKEESWYYESIMKAVSIGLVKGVGKGQFNPEATITREQMAVMLSKASSLMNLEEIQTEQPIELEQFKDADAIHSWALEDVERVLHQGLMRGMSDDMFSPTSSVTRAQAAVVISRLLQKNGVERYVGLII